MLPAACKPDFIPSNFPPPSHSQQHGFKVSGSIQPLLCLYLAGIDKLQFQPNGDISGMVSAEGELVPLKTRIKPSTVGGAVEKWLIQVPMLACMTCLLQSQYHCTHTFLCIASSSVICPGYTLTAPISVVLVKT